MNGPAIPIRSGLSFDDVVKRVVVTGFRHVRHVEFDFIYGDPDLSVELVLPVSAFVRFCAENSCGIEAENPDLLLELARLEREADPSIRRLAAIAHTETYA